MKNAFDEVNGFVVLVRQKSINQIKKNRSFFFLEKEE